MDNPEAIICIVALVIGTVIIVALSTYVLKKYSKYYQCFNSTKVWCSDNWVCEVNSTPDSGHNECFQNATSTGLASCLVGPDSVAATICKSGENCNCPDNYDGTNNCFSGCPTNLGNVEGSTACCCEDGSNCTQC